MKRYWTLLLGLAFSFSIALGAEKSSKTVYFLHGLGISAETYEKWVPLKKLFKQKGFNLQIVPTPANGTIEERATVLANVLNALPAGGPKVHLIGHSMGGLDARYAVSKLGVANRVASLTTMATPHRGSALADWVISQIDAGGTKELAARSFLKKIGATEPIVRQLTRKSMTEHFNQTVLDIPTVRYQSMSFAQKTPVELHSFVPIIWWTHRKMTEGGEPENDGFVSVQSAVWGKHLGTFASDHYSETGPIPNRSDEDFRQFFDIVIKSISLDFF